MFFFFQKLTGPQHWRFIKSAHNYSAEWNPLYENELFYHRELYKYTAPECLPSEAKHAIQWSWESFAGFRYTVI